MDVLLHKYRYGLISWEFYQKKAIEATKDALISMGYESLTNIGSGTFGAVLELKRPNQDAIAAKVVIEMDVTENELNVWKKLKHENVLSLLDVKHFTESHTFVFFMPMLRTPLDKYLEEDEFKSDKKAFSRAVLWLKDIVSGLSYLHEHNICHLDLKGNNVLISKIDKAVICDFGFVQETNGPITNYGTPHVYRPPETRQACLEALDGFAFDVWTLGFLALEMLTARHVSKTLRQAGDSAYSFAEVVYPVIWSALQYENLRILMSRAFPESKITKKSVEDSKKFVSCCMNLNPCKRPSAATVLKDRLLGGRKKLGSEDTAYSAELTSVKVNILTGFYTLRLKARLKRMMTNTVPENSVSCSQKCVKKSSSCCKFRQWMKSKKTRMAGLFKACFPYLRRETDSEISD